MRVILFAMTLGCVLAGCAPLTQTTIRRLPNGAVEIRSPKDVSIQSLMWEEGGLRIVVQGYTSNASVDAIRAQGEVEASRTEAVLDAINRAVALLSAAAAKGTTGGM